MNAKIQISQDTARELRRLGCDPDELLRQALANVATAPAPDGWTRQGVTLPNGTFLRAWHAGRAHWAEIVAGKIRYRDEDFDAPSQAAGRIAGRAMNGWEFWEAHIPGVKGWSVLRELRQSRRQ